MTGPVPRRLFLHVGTHKTGTTSFQAMLRDQAAALRATGLEPLVGPPFAPRDSANAHLLANALVRPDLKSPSRLRNTCPVPDAAYTAEMIAALHARLSEVTVPDVVISSEKFCLMRTEDERARLETALRPLFSEIVPVLCLRRVEGWRESWNNQLEKTGTTPLLAGVPDAQSTKGEWYYDTDSIVAFWQSVGPLKVIDYDAALGTDGSILPALFGALERDAPGNGTWLNRRFTIRDRLKRGLRRVLKKARDGIGSTPGKAD